MSKATTMRTWSKDELHKVAEAYDFDRADDARRDIEDCGAQGKLYLTP
jgi:hypothetical protein